MEGFPGSPSPAPERKKFKAAVIENADAVKSAARDAAETEMTKGRQSMESIKTLRGVKQRIWDYGLGRKFTEIQKTEEAKKKIIDSRNIHAAEGVGAGAHRQTKEALLNRFTSEYEETVHEAAGEKRHDKDLERQYSARIKELISQFGRDEIDEENFIEEKNRTIAEAFGWKNSDQARAAVYHADNLLEIAKEVKQAADHRESVERLIADLEVTIGRAKSGVRTEAHLDWHDKLIEKIQSTKLGALVPEATLSATVAAAGLIGERFVRSSVATATAFVGSAILGGFIVGTKENVRLKAERARYAREKAQGKGVTWSPDKEEQEKYRYQTKGASELLSRISLHNVDLTRPENWRSVSQALVDIESRIELSDRNKIDLISYSSVVSVEKERLDLDIARAKAKVALRNTMRTAFPGERLEFDNGLRLASAQSRNQFTSGEQKEKDELFNKMKSKKVTSAALKGVGIGIGIGVGLQEASAAFTHGRQGLWQGAGHKTHEQLPKTATALQSIRMWMSGQTNGGAVPSMQLVTASDGSKIKIPEGMRLYHKDSMPPHVFALVRADNTAVAAIEFDDHGKLTESSRTLLQEEGFNADQEVIREPKQVPDPSPKTNIEYLASHLAEDDQKNGFHTVSRKFWFDDNSPYKSIGNALKLDWGGVRGTGIDKNGDYVFNVFRMTPGGSFHGKQSINVQNHIHAEHLKLLLSMTRDTQKFAVEIPIRADGTAVITDPHLKELFFGKDAQGHSIFKGQYAEVGFGTGAQSDGSESFAILATHGGTGQPTIPASTGWTDAFIDTPIATITPPLQEFDWTAPPVIPIYAPWSNGGKKPELQPQPLKRLPPPLKKLEGPKSPEARERPETVTKYAENLKREFGLPAVASQMKHIMAREALPATDSALFIKIMEALSFKEVPFSVRERRQAMKFIGTSFQAPKYALSLVDLSQAYGFDRVEARAGEFLSSIVETANRISLPLTAHGRNPSWALWEIAKHQYFFTHAAESDSPHFDPMTSQEAQDQIVNHMLGWEAYQAYQSYRSDAWKNMVDADPRFVLIRSLMQKSSSRNGTLSPEDLIYLGARLRTIPISAGQRLSKIEDKQELVENAEAVPNPEPEPEPPSDDPIEVKKDAGASTGDLNDDDHEARVSNNAEGNDATPPSESVPDPSSNEPLTVHLEFKKDAGAGIGNLDIDGFEARISNNSKEQDAIAVSADEKVFVVADGLGGAGAPYKHGQVSIWSRAIAEAIARQKNISSLLEGQNLRRLAQQVKSGLEKEGVKFETTSRQNSAIIGVKTTVSAAERIGENTFSIIAIGDSPIYVIDRASGTIIKQYGEDAMTGTTDNPIRNTVGMNKKGEIIKLNDKNKGYIVNTTVDLEPGQLLVLGSDFFSDHTYVRGNLLEFIKTDTKSFHEKATAPGTAKTDDASLIVIDPYKLPWKGDEKVTQPAPQPVSV